MTKTTMHLLLARADGETLAIGAGEAADVTKVTGLESPEIKVAMSDLAVVDGASFNGVHVKQRPIHIEASYRSSAVTEEDRERLVRFFDPKQHGTLTVRVGKRTRKIGYRLEGWTLKKRPNLDAKVGFVVDLICMDPYFRSEEPIWHDVLKMGSGDVYANIENDGDDACGIMASITAVGGNVLNPRIRLYGGPHIGIKGILEAGSSLAINTEPRTIALAINNVSCFYMLDPESEAFKLPVGKSLVALESDGGYMSAKIAYLPRYLGI